MKLVVLALATLASPLWAMGADAPATQGATLPRPEAQWAQLENRWKINNGTKSESPDDAALLAKGRIESLLDMADQAKEFAAKNPRDPHARKAKKLEALSTLLAAEAGAADQEPKALRLAMAFRNDAGNSEADRFDLAARMASYQIGLKHLQREDTVLAYEKKADDLAVEFPKNAELYRIYLGVMRVASAQKARQVANKILLAPAPAEIKSEAQAMLDRFDMVGTRVPLEFTAVDGTRFQLEKQAGNRVVVYVWTAQSDTSKEVFLTVGKLAGAATLVGVNVDQDVAAAAQFAAVNHAPGIRYADARGLRGPVAMQLKIQDVPSCYVFGPDGKLVGFGAIDTLSTLVASAAR